MDTVCHNFPFTQFTHKFKQYALVVDTGINIKIESFFGIAFYTMNMGFYFLGNELFLFSNMHTYK